MACQSDQPNKQQLAMLVQAHSNTTFHLKQTVVSAAAL